MTSPPAPSPAPHWPFRQAPPARVVFKFGSQVLASSRAGLDIPRVRAIAAEIAAIRAAGSQVIIVTSGAVAAGMGAVQSSSRPREVPELQALAAIGQARLMAAYMDALEPFGVHPAQVLLTREDMEDRRRYLNIRSTMETLFRYEAVPVINENDTVTVDELKFGDNDMLSALVAVKLGAQLLAILSDVAGLYDSNPKENPAAALIPVVPRLTPEIEALAAGKSALGTGGMVTKLAAARHATRFGVATVIASGSRKGILSEIMSGQFPGTLFLPSSRTVRRGDARQQWLLARAPRGILSIDDGAVRALEEKGSSLLPVGVRRVEGTFARGDLVEVRTLRGRPVARGIANYPHDLIQKILGMNSTALRQFLPEPLYEEVIHRDNLALLP